MKTARQIIKNFNPVATKIDETGSVLVVDQFSGMGFWIDVSIDEKHYDVSCDWNQYIFSTDNENDQLRKKIQESNWVFDLATSTAIQCLVNAGKIYQDHKALWYSNSTAIN